MTRAVKFTSWTTSSSSLLSLMRLVATLNMALISSTVKPVRVVRPLGRSFASGFCSFCAVYVAPWNGGGTTPNIDRMNSVTWVLAAITDPQVTKRDEQNITNISITASSIGLYSGVHCRSGDMPRTSNVSNNQSLMKKTLLAIRIHK